MKLYVPDVSPVKSIGVVITGSVLEVPCVHNPLGSSFSNKVNKSKDDGKSITQNVAGLEADGVPDENVS